MPDLRALAVLSPLLLGCGPDATPATAYRVTSAATTKLEYAVTAEPGDDASFALSFRCEGRSFMCETWDFDTECSLEDDTRLTCEAPPWRENEDVIAFTRG